MVLLHTIWGRKRGTLGGGGGEGEEGERRNGRRNERGNKRGKERGNERGEREGEQEEGKANFIRTDMIYAHSYYKYDVAKCNDA